jgi:hypothetical protein
VLFALSIIILPQYYITGDGASHTYNAKVLFDYALNHERDFYKSFYTINRGIDPNWMSHLGIGVFLQFMPAWLADKLFQIVYVLVFAYGFRYFIRSIEKENSFLSFLFFPFLYTLPFQQGFYNYSISLGLMCWSVGFYIRARSNLENPLLQLILSILILATSFSHGMPAIYTMLLISLIWLSDFYKFLLPFNFKKISFEISRLALIFLPSAFMILLFLAKRGTGTVPHAWTKWHKFIAFLQFWTSQSTRHTEIYPAVACGILILTYLIILFFTRNSVTIQKKTTLGFVFVLMALFTFISYITCPHSIGGAGSIDIRLAFLPPMFLLLFFATKQWTKHLKNIFIGLSFLISITFLVIRFPYVMKANTIGKEIMKAGNFIDDKCIILTIHMNDWQALSKGDSLFQKDGSFIHFSDFIGAEKHLMMPMNYEAEINYFPVNWQPHMNPRESIASLIPGQYPPCGDISLYEKQIGRPIDYILIQNKFNELLCNDVTLFLNTFYTKTYSNSFVELYKRK